MLIIRCIEYPVTPVYFVCKSHLSLISSENNQKVKLALVRALILQAREAVAMFILKFGEFTVHVILLCSKRGPIYLEHTLRTSVF